MLKAHVVGPSLDFLRKIQPPSDDNAGGRWKPLKHYDLVEALLTAIADRKWKLKETRVGFSPDEAKTGMALCFVIKTHDLPCIPDHLPCLGVLSSNNRRRGMVLYAGSYDPGQKTGFVWTTSDTRHHTSKLDIAQEAPAMLDGLEAGLEKGTKIHNELLKWHPTRKEVDHVLMQACRGPQLKRFVWSKLGEVNKSLYGEYGDVTTKWSMLDVYEAYSHVVQTFPPMRQMDTLAYFVKLPEVYEG